jgi:hypothetical protein
MRCVTCCCGIQTAQARLAALEAAAAAGLEEVRGEGAGFVRLLAAHVNAVAASADGAQRRIDGLERESATAAEDARGRWEAVAEQLGAVGALRCRALGASPSARHSIAVRMHAHLARAFPAAGLPKRRVQCMGLE